MRMHSALYGIVPGAAITLRKWQSEMEMNWIYVAYSRYKLSVNNWTGVKSDVFDMIHPVNHSNYWMCIVKLDQSAKRTEWNDPSIMLVGLAPINVVHTLTHWGRVTHICVVKPTIISSDNDLSPIRCQAITWINAGILLIGPLGRKFNWNSNIFIQKNALKNIVCEMASILSRPQCVKFALSDLGWRIGVGQCMNARCRICALMNKTNIGFGYDLALLSTRPLTAPIVTWCQWNNCAQTTW